MTKESLLQEGLYRGGSGKIFEYAIKSLGKDLAIHFSRRYLAPIVPSTSAWDLANEFFPKQVEWSETSLPNTQVFHMVDKSICFWVADRKSWAYSDKNYEL